MQITGFWLTELAVRSAPHTGVLNFETGANDGIGFSVIPHVCWVGRRVYSDIG